MSEQRDLERLVARHIGSEGVTPPSEDFHAELLERARRSGQRPEWLALLKESPMRTESRLAVGSPTFRVAAILVATLLLAAALAGAGIAGSRLFAANDTIIVDQSGAGDFTSIAEAVAAAPDGHTILVRPGRYVESVAVIGKDLTITGDGDRDAIIIEAASTTLPANAEVILEVTGPHAWAFFLSDTSTHVENLTILGQTLGDAVLHMGPGTSPILEDLVIRMLGEPTGGWGSLSWYDGAGGTVRNSLVEGWLSIGPDAVVTVEESDLPRTCVVAWDAGADITIRDSVIHGCPYEKSIDIASTNSALIEGNDIWIEDYQTSELGFFSEGRPAIITYGTGPGTITIRDNEIHDSIYGIWVSEGDPPVEIVGNRIHDNVTGVAGAGDGATLTANTIVRSSGSGVAIKGGADPMMDGNTIRENAIGVSIGVGSNPVLRGNTVCDNEQNVRLPMDATLDLADNEICEDAPASPAG